MYSDSNTYERWTIGIDWGTTHRRIYVLNENAELVTTAHDANGMLTSQGRFEAMFRSSIEAWQKPRRHLDVWLAGMVGSRTGWVEAPYLSLPLHTKSLKAAALTVLDEEHCRVRILPGVRSANGDPPDVMRGEETQLLGATILGAHTGWFVLPGTHSKWVRVSGGVIESIRTYMTGELFAHLQTLGTLASLGSQVSISAAEQQGAFDAGVAASRRGALSRELFGIRAGALLGELGAGVWRDYLSGLLIGHEYYDPSRPRIDSNETLFVIGSAALAERYRRVAAAASARVETPDADKLWLAALRHLSE